MINSPEKLQTSNEDIRPHIRISYIMATFNRKDTLAQAIQSFLDQKTPDTELIVVDDGSDDGSVDLLNDYGSKLTLLTLPKNFGVGYARNVAVKLASGTYVSILDSDNKLLVGAVQRMLRHAQEHTTAIIKFPVIFRSTGRVSFSFAEQFDGLGYFLNRPKVECHTLIKRDLLLSHGFIESFNGGEGLVWIDCALKADEVRYIPEPTLDYRDVGDDRLSNSFSNANRIRQVHNENLKRYAKLYLAHRPFELVKISGKIFCYSLIKLVSR